MSLSTRVCALMASAAGTLDLADFARIQVYVRVYIGVALHRAGFHQAVLHAVG